MANPLNRTPAGRPLPEDLTDALLLALKPVSMAPKREAAVRRGMLDKIARENNANRHAAITTTYAGEGKWRPLAPNVDMQILFDDGFTASWFLRLQPGGRVPPHRHDHGDEECLVLSGSCYLDETFLQVGDYQLARRGSRHQNVHSEAGCLLFIRSPSFKQPAGIHAPR